MPGNSFITRFSPVTGKMEVVAQAEDYDYHQEVARSAYADMLHDTERNQKYYAALRKAIKKKQSEGKQANILDIGTGTGLLSMMAVTCGADSVTACEAFLPMACCAEQVIKDNKMANKIHVIHKRSTDVTVGPGGDMERRANILVTEVFDTELIGEGAIGTFYHAHKNLLEDDCIVVPSAANMYVQVADSDIMRRWNDLKPIRVPGCESIVPPPDILSCHGPPAVHDIQMSQLTDEDFIQITDPVKVFRFDYTGKSSVDFAGHSRLWVMAKCGGQCDVVLMWWDLEMDMDGEILLSCAPRWAHPTPDNMQWRDHWMQAIYYPQSSPSVEPGEKVVINSYHDDYSLWFDVSHADSVSDGPVLPPVCRCGAHIACSRSRVGMLNNMTDMDKYTQAMWRVIQPDTVCLCISDSSLLPLIAARLGAKKVLVASENRLGNEMLDKYIKCNNLSDRVKIIPRAPDKLTYEDFLEDEPTLLIGEPYFSSSILPWQHIYFWYARTYLADILPDELGVLPIAATMKCIGVDFEDLWKIRAPVGNCEGFDLHTFDKLIESSSVIVDAIVEPQPLWEYPGQPMTEIIGLMHFDLTRPLVGLKVVDKEGYITFSQPGRCSGVAIWMEYHLDPFTTITTGLVAPPSGGNILQWERNNRQGVYLFPHPTEIQQDSKLKLRYRVNFKPKTGEFDFYFKVGEVEIKPKPLTSPKKT